MAEKRRKSAGNISDPPGAHRARKAADTGRDQVPTSATGSTATGAPVTAAAARSSAAANSATATNLDATNSGTLTNSGSTANSTTAEPSATTASSASATATHSATASSSDARSAAAPIQEGRVRAVVDALLPSVDGGRFAPKRIAGEPVLIEAHCFADGHDRLRAVLSWQQVGGPQSFEVEMTARVNDVWTAEFTPPVPGRYRYTVTAWVDHFESWRQDLARRDDSDDIRIALQVGAGLIEAASRRAEAGDAAALS